MIKDISKLDDVQRNALFTIIRSFIIFLSAITASMIGWALLDSNPNNLRILAWVVITVFSTVTIMLIVIYFKMVFER